MRGIIQRFDYLLDLGINAIYLNPIFHAPSNHRYNTTDYYRIDPRVGTMLDFHALIDLAHRNSVRVVMDGVFNHCSRGFLPSTMCSKMASFQPTRRRGEYARITVDEAKGLYAFVRTLGGEKTLVVLNASEINRAKVIAWKSFNKPWSGRPVVQVWEYVARKKSTVALSVAQAIPAARLVIHVITLS